MKAYSADMKARTLITLIVAILLGAAAAVATYQTTHGHAPAHAANDDEDPGLIP